MAYRAARHGAVLVKSGGRMAMTIEAEAVEPGLDALDQVGIRTAMALDAGLHPPPVGVVVVTGEAIDRPMLVVWKVERDRDRAPNDRLAQRRVDLGGQQRRDAGGAHHGSDHDQGGMPAEDQWTAW